MSLLARRISILCDSCIPARIDPISLLRLCANPLIPSANSRNSSDTTLNVLPSAPERTASIVALIATILVREFKIPIFLTMVSTRSICDTTSPKTKTMFMASLE